MLAARIINVIGNVSLFSMFLINGAIFVVACWNRVIEVSEFYMTIHEL